MAQYLCPVHDDEVLFPNDAGTGNVKGKGFSISPLLPKEMPRECRRCGKYYYRYECVRKEVGP
ncbi:hypothetical protein L4X63_11870 [Geomonas sp. Red32]|uniref:hypothetical protein n=1 Tax=Geomonas sp. Red32 TaxID=2912856 RepID=UPI00202CA9D3|nr:hypothetical protein [Geomonas sp. Red32]MCM0082287.1 hypothetical protein [Geomonas sp. Red32]